MSTRINSHQHPIALQAIHVNKIVQSGSQQLPILRDINLSINFGETIAILGASGAGKSTLLSLLAGLDIPSSGSILLDQHRLETLNEDERALLRAHNVGFIFQTFQLLHNLTALENVMLPLELVADSQANDKALHSLKQVGLEKRLSHYPAQLSGGEQQRVAIARAFALKPKLLFADEPTGNLDQHTANHVADLLFELNDHISTTLILVTHNEILAKRAARCIKLHEGKLQP